MKNQILIIKNISREGPGLLEDLLIQRKINYKIIDLISENFFPGPENYNAVVVFGGPQSANDNNEIMNLELKRIKECIEKNIPFLGICLGMQALVKASGGKVVKSPVKETGFRDPENNFFTVELTEEGRKDYLFKNLDKIFKVFHLHGETVDITDDIKLLASGKFCHNQVVKVGKNAYGIQCHFELTEEMFEDWIKNDPDLLQIDTDKLRKDFHFIKDEYLKTGKQLLSNFLEIAGLKSNEEKETDF